MSIRIVLLCGLVICALVGTQTLTAAADAGCPGGWVVPVAMLTAHASGYKNGIGDPRLADLFRPYGVTLTSVPAHSVALYDATTVYGNDAIDIAAAERAVGIADPAFRNVLIQSGGNPVSYTQRFERLIHAFAFERSGLIAGPTGVSHPDWTATAYG